MHHWDHLKWVNRGVRVYRQRCLYTASERCNLPHSLISPSMPSTIEATMKQPPLTLDRNVMVGSEGIYTVGWFCSEWAKTAFKIPATFFWQPSIPRVWSHQTDHLTFRSYINGKVLCGVGINFYNAHLMFWEQNYCLAGKIIIPRTRSCHPHSSPHVDRHLYCGQGMLCTGINSTLSCHSMWRFHSGET